MAKKSKSSRDKNDRETTTKAKRKVEKEDARVSASTYTDRRRNPLFHAQRHCLHNSLQLTATERHHFFSDSHVSPERRAALWMAQSDSGERLVQQYAWATPDDRALRILAYYTPIVEIGCGANAYWCRQLIEWMHCRRCRHTNTKQQQQNPATAVDSYCSIVGVDVAPGSGGKLQPTPPGNDDNDNDTHHDFPIVRGGPEVLPNYPDHTLFLCYPDEDSRSSSGPGTTTTTTTSTEEDAAQQQDHHSMAASCLDYYTGDIIIHVGELCCPTNGSTVLSMDHAPWGRTSSPLFQERLLTEFHCILCVELKSQWLHTKDRLTVWKRSKTTAIVFAGDDDDDDDDHHHQHEEGEEEEEDVAYYRYIPPDEQILPVDVAAPCVVHLLERLEGDDLDDDPEDTGPSFLSSSTEKNKNNSKRKRKSKTSAAAAATTNNNTTGSAATTDKQYECPW